MKRLFKVVDRETKRQVEDVFFSNKYEAKQLRDKYNGPPPEKMQEGAERRYYIAPGPDHHRA